MGSLGRKGIDGLIQKNGSMKNWEEKLEIQNKVSILLLKKVVVSPLLETLGLSQLTLWLSHRLLLLFRYEQKVLRLMGKNIIINIHEVHLKPNILSTRQMILQDL